MGGEPVSREPQGWGGSPPRSWPDIARVDGQTGEDGDEYEEDRPRPKQGCDHSSDQ